MENHIDESLYSRQLYVLGKKAMQQLVTKKILVSGINGLGLEVSKNVILSGVYQVSLHDTNVLTTMDLSSLFYANKDDVGKNRAEICHQHLCQLNEYVKVDHLGDSLSKALISKYDVVVLCDPRSNTEVNRVNEWCRNTGAKFIMGNARGLFSAIFCDFGKEFIVNDISGTEPEAKEISTIEKSKDGLVYIAGDSGHGYCDESLVVFSGVQGMKDLNNRDPILVSIHDYLSFYVGNTEDYGEHVQGTGFVKEIFLPKPIEFKPYSHFCENIPTGDETVISDYSKMAHPPTLHLCFYALNEYLDRYGQLPRSWNSCDADKFLELVKQVSERFSAEVKHEEIIRIFSYVSRGNLNPMHASLGGIVAQEVLKAATHQFCPITQWYYTDFIECLPEDCMSSIDSDIYDEIGSRYDGQIAVFGSKFQETLANLRYFVVGAGAIGCELLKNFAMMGVGLKYASGKIFVTDMDFIERSNLNRQFLFRNWNIGKSKSHTAANAVLKMNSDLNIESHENRLGTETENVYNNSFFQSMDCVVNALDNFEARQYAAARIEFNEVPMVDSGTTGPLASQQVIIPHLTKSYQGRQTKEDTIPMCTLKNFPYQIEHTIQWAKDLFASHFTNTPKLINIFTKDKAEFFKTIDQLSPYPKFDTVNQVTNFFKTIPNTFDDCITWALCEWFTHFSKNIQQVLYSFPPDFKTAEGLPFWSGTKRVPRFEKFDVNQSNQMDFIIAATKLRARLFNIELKNNEYIKSIAKDFIFEEFIPSSEVKIATEENEIEKVLDLGVLATKTQQLRNLDFKEILNIVPQDFEKDDDSNFHIDFITSASNLRAFNYEIEPADRMKTKKIAGKIIPAMATTTSVISGQVCLELYKMAQGHKNILKYRDSFINLASPVFTMTIPEKVLSLDVLGKSYSLWNKFDVRGDISLREFLGLMKKNYDLDIVCVTFKTGVIFASWFEKDYLDDIYDRKITDIIKNKINQKIWESETVIPLYIAVEDEIGEDIEGVPIIRYYL